MMWPTQLYTARQSRDLDSLAARSGIGGYALMCRAGQAAFDRLRQVWPHPGHLHIVCGGGNNGGDGLVVARLALAQNLPVTVYLLAEPDKLQGEARQAYTDAVAAGVLIRPALPAPLIESGIIVDALLGTGLQQPVRDDCAEVISWINGSPCPVFALDLPSGLCSDTGTILGCAVRADQTITFIAAKRGLFTASGVDLCGTVMLADLAIPTALYAQVGPAIRHPELHELLAGLPPRPRNAHKGLFGHVLVIGGNYGMAGAALLAAAAAARVGAGLVSVATRPEHVAALVARHPEIMAHGVQSGYELDPLLQRATVLVIGPGMGQEPWSEQLLQKALHSGLPVIADADALNILASGRLAKAPAHADWVLTPHPGEAARLLGSTVAQVGADRFRSAQDLQQRYGGTVVLKGAGSLICSADEMALCSYGNPGMACGGMGDVLTGIIGGLVAQGMQPGAAALLGVSLHARAGDLAAEVSGERGLQATDLLPYVRELLNAAG